MGIFVLKQSVQAVLFKMSLVFVWTVCLGVAHTMADLSEASAGFSVSPSTLAYTGTVGGPNQPGSVSVTNTGVTALTVTWADPINWLVAIQPGITQTIQPGQSGAFMLTASPAGLGAGTYSGTATITDGGTIKQVPVSLTLAATTAPVGVGLSPAALIFTGTVGPGPLTIPVTITNSGTALVSFTWTDSIPWFHTGGAGAGGTLAPGQSLSYTMTANIAGLAAGSYSGIATVTAAGIAKQVPVSLTLAATTAPVGVGLSPAALIFTGTVGPGPLTIPVTITNSGTALVSFTWTDSIPWFHTGGAGAGGTLAPGQSLSYTMTANIAGLAAGSYSGIATVTAAGIAKQVPVSLTLAATTAPAIGLNTTSLGYAGTVGGTNPAAQAIAISNVGGGTLTWSAGDNATWLNLSPLSGTNSGTITASVNLVGLLSGSYTATITVTATGATAKTIPVTLAITASTSNGTIGFSPTNLAFAGTVGGTNPAAQSFTITNSGGGTLTWTLSSNAAWLRLNTASGTTTTETDTISASVTTSGLAAGTYNAVLTVTASGSTNSPRSIPVSLTLSATVASTAGLAWNANSETDMSGYKVYRATSSGSYGAPAATLPKTTTSYTATGLQTGTTYFFTITAYDNAGNESLHSAEVSKSIY